MKSEPQPEQAKALLRLHSKDVRSRIPQGRRKEAVQTFLNSFTVEGFILSYAHIGNEFPTNNLNTALAKEGKLLLPRAAGRHLRIYHVSDPGKQLILSPLGILEPDPTTTEEADLNIISLALVPGLAFDSLHHRLGYGLGFYDRFLPSLSPHIKTCGLGFKEQFRKDNLPTTPLDFPLKALLLY